MAMRDFRHLMHCLVRHVVLLSSLVLMSAAAQQATAALGVSSLPTLSPGQTATLLPNGQWLLLGGGQGGKASHEARLFDPRTGDQQRLTTKLTQPRTEHTATILPDGRVLILGGLSPHGSVIPQAEVFTPASARFERLDKINLAPRTGHTATVLTDGRVLVVGGVNSEDRLLSRAELWDPRSGQTQTVIYPNTFNRRGAIARLMPDGNVVYVGGTGSDGKPAETAFQYRSSDGQFEEVSTAEATRWIETVDQATASEIVATLPRAGADDFLSDGTLALRFSAPVDIATLNERTVLLRGPDGAVKADIVPAQDGMLLFVTPTMSLLPGARHTLFLDGAVSVGGVPLGFQTLDFGTATLNTPEPAAKTPSTSVNQVIDLPPKSKKNTTSKVAEEADDEIFIPGETHRGGRWRTGKPLPETVRALLDNDERIRAKIEARRARDGKTKKGRRTQTAAGTTGIAGTVLKLNDRPLANVTVSIGARSVRTDANGHFQLTGIAPGHHELIVDGTSANQPGHEYIQFVLGVDLKKGALTELPHALYVARIKAQDWAPVGSPAPADTVITHPKLPGLEIHIPKGTVLRDRQGKILTRLAIVPVALDRAPFPTPENFPIYFMLHPGGAIVQGLDPRTSPGIRIVYPNYTHDAPGTPHNFWLYDPRERGWFVYGNAKVNAEGTQIVPEAGVGLYENMAAGHNPGGGSGPGPEPTPPPDTCRASAGHPIDCATGLFIEERRDVNLPDVLPIDFTRTYRPGDTVVRPFGIGTTHPYALYLRLPTGSYDMIHLILPDGTRIEFPRTGGTSLHNDYVWTHTASPSRFQGAKIIAAYDSLQGERWLLTLKDGTVYTFGPYTGTLDRLQDRHGNRLDFIRSGGRLDRIVTQHGRYVDFTYDTTNRITQMKDLAGRTWTYTYTGSYLTKATYPDNRFEEYAYDTAGRMLTVKDRRGTVTATNVYDVNGRVITQTLADGGVYQFNYTVDVNGKIIQTNVTDPRGTVRRLIFNADGSVLSRTDAMGTPQQQTTTYERQAGTNLLLSATDPLGRKTTHIYDTKGNVLSITRLAGTAQALTETYTYEPTYNQVTSVTDSLGQITTFTYDTQGDRTAIIDPLGNKTTLSYNSEGQPISVTDPLNQVTLLSYDLGDLASITDPLGRVTTRYTDLLGRLQALTDPLSRRTRYNYDALDRITQITDALNNLTQLAYDNNGNLVSLTDAQGGATQHAYDAKNRLITRTDPLLKSESFTYDGNDNTIQYTDRKAQVTTYTYDPLNRRTQINYADASSTAYTYDAADRLTQVNDSASGVITHTYDNLDRLTGETTPQGSVNYGYDNASRRTALTVLGQTNISYDYDTANRLTQITQGSATVKFNYDAAARRSSLTLPNGIVATYSYDAASQLTGITYKLGATSLGDLNYAYDAVGNRTKISGTLARTNLPPTLSTATYDAANRLTDWNGTGITYDANGNMLNDGTRTYTWDARNRLTSIAGTVTANFQYDAFGRRIQKTVNGVTTKYLYDGINPVQEFTGSTPTANLLTGLNIDEYYRRTDGQGTRDFLTDGLGSTLALADNTGAIQTSYTYDPYGNTTTYGQASTNPFQYTGRENDNTGLYFYRARYYSPTYQRFITEDPIGFEGGLNLYTYVDGNPVSLIDPFGLAGHSKGKRGSTKNKHEKGDERRQRDQGGEKGDDRRPSKQEQPSQREIERQAQKAACYVEYAACLGTAMRCPPPQGKVGLGLICTLALGACLSGID